MSVHEVSSRSFQREVLESDVPVVVDFHAEWCGPCHQIASLLQRLSEEWGDRVRFVKLDIDRNRDVARAYRISSSPPCSCSRTASPAPGASVSSPAT